MFSHKMRAPARKALLNIVKGDRKAVKNILERIREGVRMSVEGREGYNIPTHLVSVSVEEEIELLISISQNAHERAIVGEFARSEDLEERKRIVEDVDETFWKVLLDSLPYAERSAPVAEEVVANCLRRIWALMHKDPLR